MCSTCAGDRVRNLLLRRPRGRQPVRPLLWDVTQDVDLHRHGQCSVYSLSSQQMNSMDAGGRNIHPGMKAHSILDRPLLSWSDHCYNIMQSHLGVFLDVRAVRVPVVPRPDRLLGKCAPPCVLLRSDAKRSDGSAGWREKLHMRHTSCRTVQLILCLGAADRAADRFGCATHRVCRRAALRGPTKACSGLVRSCAAWCSHRPRDALFYMWFDVVSRWSRKRLTPYCSFR